ncbi:MAG: glycosyltransferase family 2 protein [Planctomycetes bacterium]|nr:glycosyltransferase family 2 protein [Planctomycetota bacterium]MBI3844219.1 glycosyltransferase family 2 protein [Planctomycetota bacterium]
MPRVSVVVPLYNRTALARETIESVLSQTLDDHEIVVVDDGSEEDVASILGSLVSCVRLVRRPHGGISAARNTGLRSARGELVAFLDSDDLWLPRKLEVQVELLDAHASLAACFTNHSHLSNGAIVRARRVDPCFARDPLTALVTRPEVSTSTLVVRRTVLADLEGFDETLERGEDYDLFLRLAAGWEVGFIDEPLVHYRVHAENAARSDVLRRNFLEKRVLRRSWNALGLSARVPKSEYEWRLSDMNLAIGASLVRVGRGGLARRYFLKSARHAPTRVKPYWRWVLSLVGVA